MGGTVELKDAGLLYTLAILTVTFAGFSALLLLIRQGIGARLTALDRLITRTVVGNLFVLTSGALLPALLALYGIPETSIWKASSLLFGLPLLALLLTFPRRRFAASGKLPPLMVMVTLVGLGSLSLAAMIVYVFGNFGHDHDAAVYITALTVNFFTTAFSFVFALEVTLHQPEDKIRKTR
jgi:hypothetical protein